MRLNWIQVFEKIDNHHLQEVHLEAEQGLRKVGRKVTLCTCCKRWVSDHDYQVNCSYGRCEYSEEVRIDSLESEVKLIDRIKKLRGISVDPKWAYLTKAEILRKIERKEI